MSEQMQKIFLYAKLATQQLDKNKNIDNTEEMNKIREELNMTHEEIIEKAAKATIKSTKN